ncbi:hypothetical protein DY000_02045223 [Brassica cretica]|uniref:No apical meristem-associated C-terminal domain-containing protein n=1 Tax=Brassica cretica TaxID=69181 RepID=A0ABQ7F320_BRACR|nr:hypothetical protein DY000_02045223 [Brassica cretica]
MHSVNGDDEAMDRLIGVKAAKAKTKRPVGEEVKIPQGFKDMWEMRTKDLAFKDKLSNKKLLDSLIAKKEPLTELKVAAHEIFFNDYKVKFSLEYAWRELRNDQKWCGTQRSSQQSSGSKRKRVGEEQSFQSSASMPSVNGEDEAMDRPIGVKAAKAKAKRPVGEEVKIPQGFKDMWEMRTKDLAFKDKLSNKKLLDSLIAKKEPLTELKVVLKNKQITEMLSMGTSHTPPAMEARKSIVCCLSARGMIPQPLPQEDTDDDVADVTPSEVEVVEISDEEEADMVELSSEEYMRNVGYLTTVEESEDDLEPEFRRLLQRMHEEEKKLREEKFKAMKSGIKLEEGQSSKVDGKKRKRRS